jgi:hypothetical protein
MTGVLTDGPGSRDPASEAAIAVYDEDFDLIDEGTTDAAGRFELRARAQALVHVQTEGGPDTIPVTFPGETGTFNEFVVPDGQLWTFPRSEADAWRTQFAGCPNAEDRSGMLVGEVRLFLNGADEDPVEPLAFVRVERDTDGDGVPDETVQACYLGEDGNYDPEAQRTGLSARFGVFGIQGGPWELIVARDTNGGTLVVSQQVFIPEGGAVVRLPVFVSL